MKEKVDAFLFYLANIIFIFFRETDGGAGKMFVGILLLIYAYLFFKNITYAFLICLVVHANPARMFENVPFGWDMHFLYLKDIFLYLGFACLFSPQLQNFKVNIRLKRLLPFLYIFSLYQIVIGMVFNLKMDSPFILFKMMEQYKLFIFGIYFLIPTYCVVRHNHKLFFNTIIVLAIVYVLLFVLSVYTSLSVFEFATTNRLRGTNSAERNFIHNSELFKLTMYMAISGFFLSDFKKNLHLLIAGMLSFLIILIAMYRLEMLYTVVTMSFCVFVAYKVLNASLSKFISIIILLIAVVVMVFAFIPEIGAGMYETFNTTLKEFSGNAPKGASQTRTIIELPKHLKLISGDPVLGVGLRRDWWSNFDNSRDWGLSDIPLTSTLAMYGFLGMFIYYSRFIFLIKDAFKALKIVKLNYNKIYSENRILIYVLISLTGYFICMISFRFFYIGWELTLDYLQPQFGAFIGMFYGSLQVISNMESKNQNIKE